MTPHDQIIAIAETVGWSSIKPSGRLDGQMVGYPPSGAIIGEPEELPNYLTDLNAIQETWQCLGWEEKNECIEFLKEIVEEADCESYFATASQRAEAFLRTVGKWKETV